MFANGAEIFAFARGATFGLVALRGVWSLFFIEIQNFLRKTVIHHFDELYILRSSAEAH